MYTHIKKKREKEIKAKKKKNQDENSDGENMEQEGIKHIKNKYQNGISTF